MAACLQPSDNQRITPPDLVNDAGVEAVCAVSGTESSAVDTIAAPAVSATQDDPWQRKLYVKTNLPAWLCLWTNVAGEIDLRPHWSFNLSLYYSGFNYFKRTLKFRTFTVMPELRYWFCGRNDGFFADAHFGMIYYNVALDGEHRYQDHKGRTPALGGGIGFGYRFALPRNPRWKFEASVGYGIYNLNYDIFENRPNGPMIDRHHRTIYGIDNVAFSVCYTFDINDNRTHRSADRNGKGGGTR